MPFLTFVTGVRGPGQVNETMTFGRVLAFFFKVAQAPLRPRVFLDALALFASEDYKEGDVRTFVICVG